MVSNKLKYSCCFLIALYLLGCAPTVKLSKRTSKVESIQFAEPQIQDSLAVIDQYEVFFNGGAADLNQSTLNHMVKIFRRSNLFTNVVYKEAVSKAINNFTFNIRIKNTLDTNTAGNVTKAFFTGLSLYTLTPVLKLRYNYSSTMMIEVLRTHGEKKTYEVTTDGKAYIAVAMPSGFAIDAVRSDVLLNNYNLMIKKMADDIDFFQSGG